MKHSARGVTLLELLIAVTLLSLLSVAMFTAMRIGLSAFTKADDKLMMPSLEQLREIAKGLSELN